jgi:hypothetical protein
LLTVTLAHAFFDDPRFYSPERSIVIFTQANKPVKISQRHIRPLTVKVTRGNKRLTEQQDFEIDYKTSSMYLVRSESLPETLVVTMETFSLDLKLKYEHRNYLKMKQAAAVTVTDSLQGFHTSQREFDHASLYEQNIKVSGSKTISLTMGSQSALSMNQSLDVNINGDIARDVTINAILTDQDVPIQPDGTTRSLQEIDRVLIELESRRFKATLGDYFLGFGDTRFLNYNRKIQGAMVEYRDDKNRATASGAIERGEFNSYTRKGVEQNQGPYRLRSQDGNEDIVVLAGTEKVWVNGRAMVRGENNDYIIEYNTGQIFFTINRPIREEDYITVEYEYTTQEYEQTLVSGEVSRSLLKDRLKVRARGAQESDSRNRPIDRIFGDEEIEVLENAGDVPENAWTSGLVLIESINDLASGQPFYTWTSDSIPFLVYHPQDSFDYYSSVPRYTVVFSEDSLGNYKMESINHYSYISPDSVFSGIRYRPGSKLPLPASLGVGGLDFVYRHGKIVELKGEMAASREDRNTFSPFNDRDNTGLAFGGQGKLTLGKHLDRKRGLGVLELKADYERMDTLFRTLGPIRNTFDFQEKWNLRDYNVEVISEVKEASVLYSPVRKFSLGGGGGSLRAPNVYARRYAFGPRWNRLKDHTGSYNYENIQALKGGPREVVERHKLDESFKLWIVDPFGGFNRETREKFYYKSDSLSGASMYNEVFTGLKMDRIRRIENRSEFVWRKDHVLREQSYSDSALATTFTNNLGLGPFGFFSSQINFVDRRKTLYFADGGSRAIKSDMVDLSTTLNPFQGALYHKTNYVLSAEQSQILVPLYEEVPEGQGTHVIHQVEFKTDGSEDTLFRLASEGELYRANFIPSRVGAYKMDTTHKPHDINRTEFGMRMDLNPHLYAPLKNLKGFLGDLSASTYLRFEEEKIRDRVFGFFRYFPNPIFNNIDSTRETKDRTGSQDSTTTIRSLMEIRQDINLVPKDSRFNLRLRIFPIKTREFHGSRQQMDKNLYDLTYRMKITDKTGILDQVTHENTIQRFAYTYNHVKTSKLRNELDRDLFKKVKGILGFTVGQSRKVLSDTTALFYRIMPRIVFAAPNRGRFTMEYEYIRVNTSAEYPDYMMAEGNVPGTTQRWASSADYRFTKNIILYLYYTGKRLQEIPSSRPRIIHQGTAEFKAFF